VKRLIPLLLCLALAACATPEHMAVHTADTSIDTSTKSLLLMTLTVSQKDSPIRAPKVFVVEIDTPNAQSTADRHNFILDGEGRMVTGDGHTTYDLRMALPAGSYHMVAGTGMIRVFPFAATFLLPLPEDFTVAPNSVTYIGHIDATLRPRVGDEFSAGPLLPLLDQAAMGVSTGSFDVTVSNQSATDLPALRATFPALQTAAIQVDILPPFDRAKAQAWWESVP